MRSHPNGSLAKVKIKRDEVVVGEFAYAYDAVGLPESITYPEDTDIVAEFKSSSSARGWNENGQLTHLRYLKSGVPIREFEFDYDAAGNRTKQIDISSAGTFEWKYSYDYLDRLSKVEKKTGAGPMLEMSIYAYDESDNRTVLELPQDLVKFIYGYDDADRITTMEKATTSNVSILTDTFVSDDDGNVVTKTKTTVGSSDVTETSYTWDSFNKLIAVSSKLNGTPTNDAKQENSYLANGFRRKKKAKSGEVTTEYSAGLSTAMAKVGSDPISYIQGHHILGFEQSDSFYWFLTDALGSVRDIVGYNSGSSQWEVVQSYDYRENGEKTASTSLKSDKTWVGGLSVNDDTADSGLYLMGHRHYDATLGRFLSRDPIGFVGGLNLYEYAGSSPVNFVDPDGLEVFSPKTYQEWARNHPTHLMTDNEKMVVGSLPFVGPVVAFGEFVASPSLGGFAGLATNSVPGGKLLKSLVRFGRAGKVAKTASNIADDCPKLYRNLSAADDPARGLFASGPDIGNDIASHVNGKKPSQWISTSKTLQGAQKHVKKGYFGTVEIDPKMIFNEIVDISDGIPGRSWGKVNAYAKAAQEVVVKNHIPAAAIKWVQKP